MSDPSSSTATQTQKQLYPLTSYAASHITPHGDIAQLTYENLDEGDRIKDAIESVKREDAGAVALFLGTTRDNFQGLSLGFGLNCFVMAELFGHDLSEYAYTILSLTTIIRR